MKSYATLAALWLAGCAANPDSIRPAYVNPIGYEAMTCQQLGVEGARLRDAYAAASAQQHRAHNGDVLGIVLVGLPVSSMIGEDIGPQVARLKGEWLTLTRVAASKGCVVR